MIMPFIPQDFIEKLKDKINLSDVIRTRVDLKKAGENYKGCCPFHSEKTPSFVVNDKKQIYKCFGCGASGNIFSFLMDYEKLSFNEAVEKLAHKAGMQIPKPTLEQQQKYEKILTLYDLMESVCLYFQNALNSVNGQIARDYVNSRKLTTQAVKEYRIGYAPAGNELINFLKRKNYTEDQMAAAGIVKKGENGTYVFFRDRLMFPIFDKRGRVVAFTARILRQGEPKYINTPDTDIFHKGDLLYGDHLIKNAKQLIVVEGTTDVIAMAMAGYQSVAPLGTALTENQIERLWQMVQVPILMFDGDSAGQKAKNRAIIKALPILQPEHSLQLISLPQGKDPDEVLKIGGKSAMDKIIQHNSKGLFDGLFESQQSLVNMTIPEGKAGFKNNMRTLIKTIKDFTVQNEYLKELNNRLYPNKAIRQSNPNSKPKELIVSKNINLQGVMAGILNYPSLAIELKDELGYVNKLKTNKFYIFISNTLNEHNKISSEELIYKLQKAGFEKSINNILNDKVLTHFSWVKKDNNKNIVAKNIKQLLNDIKEETRTNIYENDTELDKILEEKRNRMK